MPPETTPLANGAENRVNSQVKSPQDKKGNETEATQEEKRVLKMANKLWDWSKADRKKYEDTWQEDQDYYDGKQWKKRPPSYRAAPNINVCRSTVETILPILTDTQHGLDVLPKVPEDNAFSDTLSKTVQDWWNRRSMDLAITDFCKDSLIYDCAIIKVIWNDELERGAGDIEVNNVDIRNLWVNQGTTSFDKGCQWAIERLWKPVGELRQQFPDKADKICPSGENQAEKDKEATTYSGKVTLVSPIDRKAPLSVANNQTTSTSEDDYKSVEVLEMWIKDDTVEEYILGEKEEGKKEETGLRKKYPNGRIVTWLPGKQVLLQDAESPYNDGRFPYVAFVDTRKPRSFYGDGEIAPLKETQNLLNKSMAVLVDWMNTMANPVWIVDNTSGVDVEMLTNQVGLIVPRDHPGTEVRREMAPSPPSELFNLYSTFQALADQVSGINDVTQGRRPQGITAAEALQTMQEAAQTRIRLKERNLQVALSRMGELVISRILQFYTEPRIVRVHGDEPWPEYFSWYVEPVEETVDEDGEAETKFVMHKQKYNFNEETDEYIPENAMTVSPPSKGMFDVEVQGGTSLPYLRERRGEMAMRLRQMGDIDRESLLSTIEWPDKEKVLNRLDEAEQKQAAAEQQAAQQQQVQA